jgi:hypothetical protein
VTSTERPLVPDAGQLLALADDHRHGLHEHDAHAECSQCLVAPLLRTEDEAAQVRTD